MTVWKREFDVKRNIETSGPQNQRNARLTLMTIDTGKHSVRRYRQLIS